MNDDPKNSDRLIQVLDAAVEALRIAEQLLETLQHQSEHQHADLIIGSILENEIVPARIVCLRELTLQLER